MVLLVCVDHSTTSSVRLLSVMMLVLVLVPLYGSERYHQELGVEALLERLAPFWGGSHSQ